MPTKLLLIRPDGQPARRELTPAERRDRAAAHEAIRSAFGAMAVAGRCREGRAIAGRYFAYPLASASRRARERAFRAMKLYGLERSARETLRELEADRAAVADSLRGHLVRGCGEAPGYAG